MRLQVKTALITGGNSGIGLTTACLFVAEAARVAITGRNKATLDAVANELWRKPTPFSSRCVGRQGTRDSFYDYQSARHAIMTTLDEDEQFYRDS